MDWLGPLHQGGGRPAHVLRGFTKAFLVYALPVTLLARKLHWQTLRRAAALGVFVGGVRTMDSVRPGLPSLPRPAPAPALAS